MAVSKFFTAIKRRNGEEFAQKLRNYHSGILDIPDIASIVKYAGNDAEPLLDYFVSLMGVNIEEHTVYQEPEILANQAGYDFYYVSSYEELQEFHKYYAPQEQLCTFSDESRCDKYHVMFLVKKDWATIPRGVPPKREDDYGLSVLSIQILKTGGFISIKNRYNHSVENPDNTLYSNPDRIIRGLAYALKEKYQVDFSSNNVDLEDNFVLINNQIIKYNKELQNIYFGDDFYVENGKVIEIKKEQEILIDKFILNLNSGEITNVCGIEDGFVSALQFETEGKKLEVVNKKDGTRLLMADGTEILELNGSSIRAINMPNVERIDDNFLIYNNDNLISITMNNVTSMGDNCLYSANKLKHLEMKKLQVMGDECFTMTGELTTIEMNSLQEMGKYCFNSPSALENASFNILVKMDDACFVEAQSLKTIQMNSLQEMGTHCFCWVNALDSIEMNKLETIEEHCFYATPSLTSVTMKSLRKYDSNSFNYMTKLSKFDAPNATIPDEIKKIIQKNTKPILQYNKIKQTYVQQSYLVNSIV